MFQAHVEATQKRSLVVEKLQALRDELNTNHERKKEAKKQQKTSTSSSSSESSRNDKYISSSGQKTDLYRVAMQLREANKISQYLKKDTVSIIFHLICLLYDLAIPPNLNLCMGELCIRYG